MIITDEAAGYCHRAGIANAAAVAAIKRSITANVAVIHCRHGRIIVIQTGTIAIGLIAADECAI